MKIEHITNNMEEIVRAWSMIKEMRENLPFKQESMIGWKTPCYPSMTINLGGAVQGVGCVIKDHRGKWIVGEGRNVGLATLVTDEIMAIFHGSQVAWRQGCRHAMLEINSIEAIKIITEKIP